MQILSMKADDSTWYEVCLPSRMKSQERSTWEVVELSFILMNFPIESVSKSPQDKQNEQSHSQSSSWWAKISLCKVESQRVKISCSMHTQNLKQERVIRSIFEKYKTHELQLNMA